MTDEAAGSITRLLPDTMHARLGEHPTVTCTDAPELSDGGRRSLTPTWIVGADQPPRTTAGFAVCGVGRGFGRCVAVGIGRGAVVARGVAGGAGRGVTGAGALEPAAEGSAVGTGDVPAAGVDAVAAGSADGVAVNVIADGVGLLIAAGLPVE